MCQAAPSASDFPASTTPSPSLGGLSVRDRFGVSKIHGVLIPVAGLVASWSFDGFRVRSL